MRDELGSDTIIIGGFDATSFARDPLDRVVRELLNAVEPMRDDPRFVLGHEEISPAAKWESVLAVTEVLEGAAHGVPEQPEPDVQIVGVLLR